VTRSPNSIFFASLRLSARCRRYLSVAVVLLLFASGGHASAAADETEARALFTRFVAAQNAHNAGDVRAMLWNSPSMLLFSRGVETRGPEAAISDDVMQILVPIVFTRGLPGDQPQDNAFLISQTFVRDATGWHVASILPIANTQLK